mmetsp:Transcript_7243/g.18604  ORF Transcript_7243/g.18604 Transcript_7243/m.18604 type:complete len:269 (-) Transcript_7243:160-966(-)
MVLPTEISYANYSAVYNALSFVMAAMGASTVYFFFHAQLVQRKFQTALCITGLVTLIAFYHYWRIFNSWTAAYTIGVSDDAYTATASGQPFNDAYRYMDWLLTVPLLLIELIMVMSLDDAATTAYSTKLGIAAALMIILGYPGEITDNHSTRWIWWTLAMIPFLYIVYTLFVGLADAVEKQPEAAKSMVSYARYVTIISWLTYPVVYIIPMLGASGASALVGVQIGYSISDFISKCGVGLMITKIAIAKSNSAGEHAPLLDGGVQTRY